MQYKSGSSCGTSGKDSLHEFAEKAIEGFHKWVWVFIKTYKNDPEVLG